MQHGHMHRRGSQVCANHSNHALQTFQHPVLALSPLMAQGRLTVMQDLAAECLDERANSIAGSL